MKKLLVLVILLLSTSFLFSETEILKIGSLCYDIYTPHLWLNSKESSKTIYIVEICPINDKICKVVFSNGFTEYFRAGDVLSKKKSPSDKRYDLKILNFDYNEIKCEKIES